MLNLKHKIIIASCLFTLAAGGFFSLSASAVVTNPGGGNGGTSSSGGSSSQSTVNLGDPPGSHKCGGVVNGQDISVTTSIDIGCKGQGNPIMDVTFAIIRVLSDGVGLVIVGSFIVGGIQYSASRNDPKATATAVHRIQSTLIALLIYIFGYAILNYLIPAGFLTNS